LDTDLSWNIIEEQRLERTADATGVLSPLYSVDLRGLAGNGMLVVSFVLELLGLVKRTLLKIYLNMIWIQRLD
jgi:hypothetical protein